MRRKAHPKTAKRLVALMHSCIALLGAAFALLNYAFDEIGNPALRPVRKVRRKEGAQERV